MIKPAPNCNSQAPLDALRCDSYEKLEEQCFRGMCCRPGPVRGADGAGASRALILIRFQDEPNSGRVLAWQDHAGLIHSLLSVRN